MDAPFNYLRKIALLFATALFVAAPSFGQITPSVSTVNLSSPSVSPTIVLNSASPVGFTYTTTVSNLPFFSVTLNGAPSTTPATLYVSLTSSSCTTSTCTGSIKIHPADSSGDVTIAVNYVTGGLGGGVITVPSSVNLNTVTSGSSFQDVSVTTTSSTPISFAISTPTTTDGHTWLAVGASPGSNNVVTSGTPSFVRVSVNAAGLPNGTYHGSFTVTPTGGAASAVQVVMTVGTGGNTGSFSPTTTLVSFSYPSGLQTQTIFFNNTSAVNYTASYSSSNGWLSGPASGQLASGLTVSVNSNAALLATGNYSGSVSLNDGSVITVNLAINGASNGNFSPSSLTFSAALGSAQQSQTVTVANVTGIDLSSCPSWVGVAQNGLNTYLVTVYPTSLTTAGVYTCNISFGTPGSLPVTLNLGNGGGGGGGTTGTLVAPSSLAFTYAVGGDTPPSQSLTVAAAGTYTVSTSNSSGGTAFISASGSGTGPGLVGVSVIGGLPAGTYNGSISVATSSGTQNIGVTLVVTGGVVVTANPGSFNVSWQPGSASTVSTITVSSSDGSAIPVTLAASAAWVKVAGVSSTTTPLVAQVTIDPSTLGNGLNSASLTITATGAANSTTTVPVVALVSGSSGGGGGNLTLGSSSLTFNAVLNGALPAAQTLGVSSNPSVAFAASVTGTNCGWLSISPTGSLTTNQNIAVTVNQAGLAVGSYSCNISLVSGGLTQTVGVTLVVSTSGGGGGSGNITASPTSLDYTYVQGGEVPGIKGIVISSASGSASVGVSTSVTAGSSWLSVTPATASTSVTLSVSVSPAGLDAGVYKGNIRVTPNGGTVVDIPVTLTVQSLTVAASPTDLSFTYRAGDPAPAAQSISVSGGTGLTFSATPTSSGWLKVTPTTGTTPASLSVTVDPTSLTSAGTITGSIVVAGTGTSTGSTTVNVSITVTAPLPTISGVTNGASFASASTISAGEIITIFGTNIGPSTPAGLTLDSNGRVATTIGGVQVLIGGYPSPMIYASGTQVSAVVPYEIAAPVFRVNPSIQVKYLGQTSNGVQVTQVASVPALFTANSSGSGPGAILNSNNSANSPGNPANKGETVVLYLTGEGQTTPAGVSGKVTTVNPAGNPLTPQPLLPIAVRIGGQPAKVDFYGEAPGIVSGVMQINVEIPATASSGNQSVDVQVGTGVSQTGVTVSVK